MKITLLSTEDLQIKTKEGGILTMPSVSSDSSFVGAISADAFVALSTDIQA